MLLILRHITSGFLDALPDISNLILVLVGIVMSLPALAERIEINRKTRFSLATACLLVGIGGFIGSLRERQHSTLEMTRLMRNVDTLVTDAGALVRSTNTVLTTVGVLTPQVTVLNGQVAKIDARLREAKEKHDSRLVAELEIKANAAQKLADAASQTLSATLLPKIVEQLKEKEAEFETTGVAGSSQDGTSDATQKQLSEAYRTELAPLVFSANLLRQQVLPAVPQAQDDRSEAAIFGAAAQGDFSNYSSAREIAYLQGLVRRTMVPKPPGYLTASVQ